MEAPTVSPCAGSAMWSPYAKERVRSVAGKIEECASIALASATFVYKLRCARNTILQSNMSAQ